MPTGHLCQPVLPWAPYIILPPRGPVINLLNPQWPLTTMVQRTFLNFVSDQLWKVHPVVHVDLTGKTVVVVGANVGLGFEAAKHFALMNPKRLVLNSRSQEKGQAAVQGKRGYD